MINRKITKDVQAYLKHFPSILITGARQVGKSTLAITLGIEHYVTLDDIATYQSAKSDPKGFILSLQKPVVIDEIQRVPELFVAIKEQIDLDRTPGRFILTGSSNLQGFRNLSDSLAGRIGIIDLYAFSLAEMYDTSGNFIDQAFSGKPFTDSGVSVSLDKHVIEGGFPEVQTIEHTMARMLWFTSYIRPTLSVLCHLLRITTPEALYASRDKGAIYETFVMSELIKANTSADQPVEMSFYRTSDGKEIDFILDNGSQLVTVEIKASQSVSTSDFKHIKSFISEQPNRVKQGIVMYLGERILPFGECDGVPLCVPIATAFTTA